MGNFKLLRYLAALGVALLPLTSIAEQGDSFCASNRVRHIVFQQAEASAPASCESMSQRLLEQVRAHIRQQGVVLLGEIHDNPHHHFLRAWLLDRLRADGLKTAVVLEHVQLDQQDRLDALAWGTTGDTLLTMLEWEKSGWPARHLFAPLFDLLGRAQFPLVAGSIARAQLRSASGLGLPPMLEKDLLQELELSHCGLIPASAFGPMLRMQLARDHRMALQLLAARDKFQSAVLLAGNGHIRRDRGVPFQLRELSTVPVLSIAFEEEGQSALDRPPADWSIETLSVFRPDPCVAMRKQLGLAPRPL